MALALRFASSKTGLGEPDEGKVYCASGAASADRAKANVQRATEKVREYIDGILYQRLSVLCQGTDFAAQSVPASRRPARYAGGMIVDES